MTQDWGREVLPEKNVKLIHVLASSKTHSTNSFSMILTCRLSQRAGQSPLKVERAEQTHKKARQNNRD